MSTVSGLRGTRGGSGFTLVGGEKLIASLRRIADNTLMDMREPLKGEGNMILNESRMMVPVDEGDLVQSGRVEGPFWRAGRVDVYVGYGGPAVAAAGRGYDYSVIQHQNMSYRHPNGGFAKFLEVPAMSYGFGQMPNKLTGALIASLRRRM